MSGQDEFNSEESIAFAENTTHFNLSIDKNTIVGFKLLLNYVPIPPVVTIIPE